VATLLSLRSSAATYDEAIAGHRGAGAHCHHLFNLMPAPSTTGRRKLAVAVLQTEEVRPAEKFILWTPRTSPRVRPHGCCGEAAIRANSRDHGRQRPRRPAARIARRASRPADHRRAKSTAGLEDGTIAGSVLTMDRAFPDPWSPDRHFADRCGTICATTPARELGRVGHGVLAPDGCPISSSSTRGFVVVQTYLAGQLVYSRTPNAGHLRLSGRRNPPMNLPARRLECSHRSWKSVPSRTGGLKTVPAPTGRERASFSEAREMAAGAPVALYRGLAVLLAAPGGVDIIGADVNKLRRARGEALRAVAGKPDVVVTTFRRLDRSPAVGQAGRAGRHRKKRGRKKDAVRRSKSTPNRTAITSRFSVTEPKRLHGFDFHLATSIREAG